VTAPRQTDQVSFDDVRWTTCDLDDFQDLYWNRIAPLLEADGVDPSEEKPTQAWIADHGARAYVAALRRHHDRAFGEFWQEDLGLGGDDTYEWATTHDETVDVLEGFLDQRARRYDLANSSVSALRSRLNVYVDAYTTSNETENLLAPVARESDVPAYEAVDACYAAFDHLKDSDYSARTLQRVRRAVDTWYQHLVGRRIAGLNPASGLYDEFKFDVEPSSTPALSAEQIRALAEAAETTRERLLIVALAAWGLRASEVASLHIDQIHRPDGDDSPYLGFEERKNGPGEVSLLYGLDVVDDRVDEFLDDQDEWAGYLFPSNQGSDPHVTRERVWAWFRELADCADLPNEIDGEQPSPQHCRRFWYDTYSAVLEQVLDGVEEIAAEQGSDDPQVVMENYLSDERARTVRREFMKERLTSAFS
jgi:integrase